MILEIAQIEVKAGMEQAFEEGAAKAVPLFRNARGCHGMELQRSIENPRRYRLIVQWETVEDHTVHFRNSTDFQKWRELVSHCFEKPPEVEHTSQALKGF
jgi:quinol monooxygenase YgiN